jgi:O-acetyl-ADP-ribose deacetylase
MGKLDIVSGNIFNYLDNKDLIVNSANKYMMYGSGVCGAIYKLADKDLLEEYCKNNYSEYMKVNEVRITPGFNLGIDILHIYCPISYESKEPLKELLDSYNKIFECASEKGYKNIVSVSIGTGIHGYKHIDIAKDVVIRLKELVNKYDISFTLVLPNEEIKKIYSI